MEGRDEGRGLGEVGAEERDTREGGELCRGGAGWIAGDGADGEFGVFG